MIADLVLSTDSNRILAAPQNGAVLFCVYDNYHRLVAGLATIADWWRSMRREVRRTDRLSLVDH
jgi:hypothetical protein